MSLAATLAGFMLCLWFGVPGAAFAERAPAVAGQFYPGDADELNKMVDGYLALGDTPVVCSSQSRLVGLIVPHAGYIYSGQTAAKAFRSISGHTFDRVYFLGVDHHSGLDSVSVWTDGGFRTPIGTVPLDATAAAELLKPASPIIGVFPEQHLQEHSLEVEMPFALKTLHGLPAVFVSVGGKPENGPLLGARLLREVQGFPGRVLIVASSDWSHYHDQVTAKTLDDQGLKSVLGIDPDTLLAHCLAQKTELCGLNGVLTLLTVMKGASGTARLIDQTDSAKASGDSGRVVGYAAVLFEAKGPPETHPSASAGKITSDEKTSDKQNREGISMEFKHEALKAVRQTLEAILRGGTKPAVSFTHERFSQKCGVFVTLKKQGELRGCIGLIEGIKPLGEAIQEMAIAAATEDPRFPPVTQQELAAIDIEISVLSPMIPVSRIDEVIVGRDGVLLRKSGRSGVFLPQVATEQHWDRDAYLENLCYKAGLPARSHLEKDAKLFRFTADVFGEKEPEK